MFYLADETHRNITGELVHLKGLLYFKHERAGYEGKATKEHIKEYGIQFQEFKTKNPSYVLPESFRDFEIGLVSAVAQPVAVVVPVAPVVELVKEVKLEEPKKVEKKAGKAV